MLLNNIDPMEILTNETNQEILDKYKREVENDIEEIKNVTDVFDKLPKITNKSFPVFKITSKIAKDDIAKIIFDTGSDEEIYSLKDDVEHCKIDEYNYVVAARYFINNLNIHTIEINSKLSEAIDRANEIYQSLMNSDSKEEIFYGILLTRTIDNLDMDNSIINPFHPLVATYLKYLRNINKLDKEDEKYNIKIYSININDDAELKNIVKFGFIDKNVEKEVEKYKKIIEIIRRSKTEFSIVTNISSTVDENRFFYVTKENFDENGEPIDSNIETNYIVPAQVLIKYNIVYPYTATSYIRKGRGYSITFFKHANIQRGLGVYSEEEKTIELTGICTGSEPVRSFSGAQTMNHCNLDSPYRNDIFPMGFILMGRELAKLSIDIMNGKHSIKPSDIKIEIMSFEDFQEISDELTLNDYLRYIQELTK